MSILSFSREEALWAQGYPRVAGVDEAGRGPLAGPVFAAACIFLAPLPLPGLNDSKKLSETERERLFTLLTTSPSISYAIASVDVETIEQINILQAALLAMRRAVEALPLPPTYLLIDGNRLPKIALPAEAIVGGDALVPSIAAASILAKVSRDRLMAGELHARWPHYHFKQHKGYATAQHRAALLEHGPCPIHRKSFLKKTLSL